MKVLLSGVDVVYCALQRLRRSAFCSTFGGVCFAARVVKRAVQHIWRSVHCSSAALHNRSAFGVERALQRPCCSVFAAHVMKCVLQSIQWSVLWSVLCRSCAAARLRSILCSSCPWCGTCGEDPCFLLSPITRSSSPEPWLVSCMTAAGWLAL